MRPKMKTVPFVLNNVQSLFILLALLRTALADEKPVSGQLSVFVRGSLVLPGLGKDVRLISLRTCLDFSKKI